MDRRRGLEPVLEAATADDSRDRVATDGGELIIAGDEGEVLEESEDDGCPEDCDCAEFLADGGLPCWPCYREDFREPASTVTAGEGAWPTETSASVSRTFTRSYRRSKRSYRNH